VLRYERDGVSVEFQLREKHKQVQRPLTADEKRWRFSSDKDWKLDLEATGLLLFEFKTWSLGGLRKNWLESEAKPMEMLLPGIVAIFVAAIPLLVEEKRRRDEEERRWRDEAQQRREEEQRRRLDAARWRKFLELAGQMREADLARSFLERIRANGPNLAGDVDGSTVGEWLGWVEARIAATDPLAGEVADIFAEVADTSEWDYRD